VVAATFPVAVPRAAGRMFGLRFEGALGPRILENCIVRVHLRATVES
jgi:hypothetical protein